MSAYTAMVISNALQIIGIASVVIFAPGYWKFMAIVVLVSGYKVEKKIMRVLRFYNSHMAFAEPIAKATAQSGPRWYAIKNVLNNLIKLKSKKDEKMIAIPDINKLDCTFGNIEHLPKWEIIPDKYKNLNGVTCWNKFVSKWFFGGLTKADIDALKPKEGVDKTNALSAIKSILCSWKPKQEHKEAGTAYLMSEWFEEN